MRMREFPCNDFSNFNVDQEKVTLVNKLVKHIRPLVKEFQETQIDEMASKNIQIREKMNDIKELQKNVIQINNQFKKQQKLQMLLHKIYTLVNSGLVPPEQTREIKMIVRVSMKFNNDQIDMHLVNVQGMLRSRLSNL